MALWLDWNNDLLCLELPPTPGKNLDKIPSGKTDELIGLKRKLDLSENLNNAPFLKESKIENGSKEKGKMNKVKAWARILKSKKVLCIPHNLKRSEPTDWDRENLKEERQTKTDLKSLENKENGSDVYTNIFQIMRYDLPQLLSPIPDVDYYIEEGQAKSSIKKSVSKTEETKLKRSQPKKADEGRLKEKKKQKPDLQKKTPDQKYDDDFFENVFQMAKYDLPELLSPIPELVPLDPEPFLRNGNLRSSYINEEPMIIKRKKKKKTSNRKKDCEDLRRQVLVKSIHEPHVIEENRERELNTKKTVKPERINEEQRMGDLCRNIEVMRYDLPPLVGPIHKQEETQHQPPTGHKRSCGSTKLNEPQPKKRRQDESISRPQQQQKPKPKGGLSKLQRFRQKVIRHLGFKLETVGKENKRPQYI